MHDAKMGYALLQHCLWNRTYTPFLLCKCSRGDAVRNADHVCEFISQDEYVELNDKSSRQWYKKSRERKVRGKQYDLDAHHAWIDKHNHGISHLGINPNHLRLDNLRFDVFHLTQAISKRLMTALRTFIFKQSCEVMDRFVNEVLKTFWCSYNLDVWTQNKVFSSFIGREIRLFITNIQLITEFLEENFNSHEYLDSIITGLKLWVKLCTFIHLTTIDDDDDYKNKMDTFERNLKNFFTAGGISFLTKGAVMGDDETFYMHFLRFYIPKIAKETFEENHLGVGVFTMQGYERRNKETKRAYNRHTNGKGYFPKQTLCHLLDHFHLNKIN